MGVSMRHNEGVRRATLTYVQDENYSVINVAAALVPTSREVCAS
jgi:hypothetical protein